MVALIIVLLFLISLFFMALYAIYAMTFKSIKDKEGAKRFIPNTDQYAPYRQTILDCVDKFETKPHTNASIKSFDGLTLRARVYDRNSELIEIQFHGYKSHAIRDFCGASHSFETRNNTVIVVDQRAHGESEGKTITFGIKERYDVVSWVKYALDTFGNDKKIILTGVSMGAATVLMASELDLSENVIGIIADCPYSSPKEIILKVAKDRKYPRKIIYPLMLLSARLFAKIDLNESSAVNAVKNTSIPILLIHGDDDRFVPYYMSVDIYNACASYKEMLTIPGAGHILCYFCDNEKYVSTVNEFIKTCISKSKEL